MSRTNRPLPHGGFGEAFANRLRNARLAARGGSGLGQQEIADAVGLSQATISDYERGRRRPNLATLLALARLLGVSADWLLTGDDAADSLVPGGRPSLAAKQGQTSPAQGRAQTSNPSPGLLDSSLVDLLGLSRLSYLGEAGMLGTSDLAGSRASQPHMDTPVAAADPGLRAAEQRTPYRAVAMLTPRSDLAVSREMSSGAESVILYTGPATGGLAPGDLLLVGPRDTGRPGMLVVALGLPTGSLAATGPRVYAVAPHGGTVPPDATLLGTVLAILRRID